MKHLVIKSRPRTLPLKAEEKGGVMINPCLGLSGKELKTCEKKNK